MELFNKYILQLLYFMLQVNSTNINLNTSLNTTFNDNSVNVPSDIVIDSTIFYEDT
jgi:hypothetical protein